MFRVYVVLHCVFWSIIKEVFGLLKPRINEIDWLDIVCLFGSQELKYQTAVQLLDELGISLIPNLDLSLLFALFLENNLVVII